MSEEPKLKSRLSAVLVGDIVSYTSQIEADTDATLSAWREVRENVIRPCVKDGDGRIVKFTGDGFLAEFASVERAVSAAIRAQTSLMNGPLVFRMGLWRGRCR